jgi:hypothetical protein
MSELFNDKTQLYTELGIPELIEPQAVNEDPILSTSEVLPFTDDLFVSYFEKREFPGSPSEGYLSTAKKFINSLDEIVQAANNAGNQEEASAEHKVVGVITNPLPPAAESGIPHINWKKAERLYQENETAASHAFRGQIDFLVHSRLVDTNLDNESHGRLLYTCRYHPVNTYQPVNFFMIEGRGADSRGEYTTLELRTHLPPDMSGVSKRKEVEEKQFFTTGQTEEAVLDLYETVDSLPPSEWPIIKVDEIDIVRNWIGHKAA